MNFGFTRSPIALAVIAAVGTGAMAMAPQAAQAAKTPGKYVAGDFHNHTTCSDGTISMQKLVNKATAAWGLDWFVQAGHGGNGNRNCTLVEDASLATPAYPFLSGNTPINTAVLPAVSQYNGPQTTWAQTVGLAALKGGNISGTVPSVNGNMWRWQSIQEYQYPVMEYLSALQNVPLFIGMESVVAGHEHTSMSVITGQMPTSIDTKSLPSGPGYTADGNANALAQWSYCFDRGDTDNSRGAGQAWDCSVPGSLNAADPSWNGTAFKLVPASGTGNGTKGHNKTVEAVKWMAAYHPNASYYVPAHLERAGPFNADGNQGYNVEHLRNFNNAAPNVAFGFETQPGHGASANRGEYQVLRNGGSATWNFGTFIKTDGSTGYVSVDTVGGTTYGGTGVYGALVGGVWDALLGEGRNWWFFASSDWHNRGLFGADDRRSTQDFQPGEYQRNYTMVRNGADKLRPQSIVDGLRTGNVFASSGQLVDRVAFVACASYPGFTRRSDASVEAIAVAAATNNTDIDVAGCATMGEKLKVRPGAEIVVSIVVRDPAGSNNSPYSFPNPSLAQIGVSQPLNAPVLDHIDLIRGTVSGYKVPGAPDYSGEWPRNTNWLKADGTTFDLSVVPAAAKNTTASVIRSFSAGAPVWTPVTSSVDGTQFLKMTYRIPASQAQASQYLRLRGSNLPASVPYETDASGNPLSDVYTNANDPTRLKIPCNTVGTNVPATATTWAAFLLANPSGLVDGCPAHLTSVTVTTVDGNGVSTTTQQKMVSFDIAAWSDLWFYSNPIYVEVGGSTLVAGVQ
jgi:hypothetical protein